MRRVLRRLIYLAAPICILISPSMAEMDRVYRSVRALSGKEMQVAVFGRMNTKECKPLPLPEIRVIAAPEHGSLVVRAATLSANNYPSCPNLRLRGQLLLYTSALNYIGSDIVSFTVTFENGQTQAHQISIIVSKEGEPSKPEEL